MYKCIEHIKQSKKRDRYYQIVDEYINTLNDEEKEKAIRQFYYINEFYKFYQKRLYGIEEYCFDYADLLYYASKYIDNISNDCGLNFEYIIIDEYQDISQERYELAKKTAIKNNSKVFAVGDDWQSIYAFSGSRIDYIYNFNKYFTSSKMFRITNTYRNSQELINTSGEFIMRNPNQIKKKLISSKHISNPIKLVYFDSSTDDLDKKDEEYCKTQLLYTVPTYDGIDKTYQILLLNSIIKEQKYLIDKLKTEEVIETSKKVDIKNRISKTDKAHATTEEPLRL